MRSAFDHRDFAGARPRRSATKITARKTLSAHVIQETLGRYSGSERARSTQAAKQTSRMILKAKALVVINGKKRLEETKNGINGIIKSPTKISFFGICLF